MLRKGFLLWAVLLLLPALLSAYTVVLKDGRRIEAQSRYVVEGNLVKFVGTDGRPYQFALAEVDFPATRNANAAPKTDRPKVWTNEDLERLSGAPVNVLGTARPPAPAAGQGAAGEPGEKESKPAPPKEDTAEYWQERLQPLRDEIARIEQQIQRLRSGQGQAASNAVSLLQDAPGVDVADTIQQLERRRAALEQQIADIQLEAKRKGIPPGKLR